MTTLSFVKSLDAEQIEYAMKVRHAAEAMGVNPTLALAIAYQEGKFRPNTPRGADGEVGMMQIKPATAAGLGYSMKDLMNPEKNIEAGVKYLKEALDVTGNDIRLAPIYYNGGPATFNKFASGQDYDKRVDDYYDSLAKYGTFKGFDKSQLKDPVAPQRNPLPAVTVEDPAAKKFEQEGQKELTRDEFGFYGAGLGAGAAVSAAGVPLASGAAANAIGNILAQVEQAKAKNLPATAPATAPAGGLPAGGAPTMPQTTANAPMGGLSGQQPMGPADAGRMAQGQTGVIPYNTAKALGVTDIEAGQALTNTKQQGGAWDIANKRAESLNKLQSMGMGNFAENPRYGGIMTQAPSVGGGVRVDPATGTPQSFAMRVPEGGTTAELSVIPKAAPVSNVVPPPPVPSGLDQAKNMFTSIMRQTSKFLPYVAAPVAGYSLGRDVADMYMGYEQPPEERDYLDLGLTGLGALATAGSFTPAAPLAIPASMMIPAARNLRRTIMEKRESPEEQLFINQPVTQEELSTANRPYIGYPRIR